MSYKLALLGSVAVCAFALTAPAQAQSNSAFNGQIQALQDQIRQLNQQLQNLQSQVNQTQQSQAQTQRSVQQIQAQPQAASTGGIIASMPNNRPTLSTADGQNTISLTGRIHFDMGDYLDYNAQRKNVGPNDLNSGVNLRRGRIGVLGKVMGDWNYALIYDFGGSNDSGPGNPGGTNAANSGGVEQAWLSYSGFKPVTFEGGYMDLPWTLDEATSSNDIMFMERATPGVIAANLAAGDFRSAIGGHWNTDRAWAGIYGTSGESGASHAGVGQQFGAVGRATYQVLQNDDYSLHIGADVEGLIKPPSINGIRSITSFSDRPELRIDTTQILNTGTIGTVANPVTNASVYGAELAGGFGSFFSQAEYYHYNVARQGAPDLDFDGGYIEGSYTITGEHRKYIPGTGAYSGISPAHPFSIANGGMGAWELAARYSVIDLNDLFTPGVTTTTNGVAVAGGHQEVMTFGVNWYVNNNIRFMLDYLHGFVDKKSGSASTAPLGTGIGGNFDALAVRTQIAW
jgi:phosphate-selective porin OprO and OprP